MSAVSGRAEWRLRAPGAPLPEELFLKVRRLPDVKAAAPVVESILELEGPGSGPVLLLGVDPFAEAAFREYEFGGTGGTAAFEDFLSRPGTCFVSEPWPGAWGSQPGPVCG